MSASTQKKKAIVVLISGNGTNLQAIIDAIHKGEIENTEIKLVVSNRKDAFGLKRAEGANIPTLYFPLKPYTYLLRKIFQYYSEIYCIPHPSSPQLPPLHLPFPSPPPPSPLLSLSPLFYLFSPSFTIITPITQSSTNLYNHSILFHLITSPT